MSSKPKRRSRRRLAVLLALSVSPTLLLLLHCYPANLATQVLHISTHLLADDQSRAGHATVARLLQTTSTQVFPFRAGCGNAEDSLASIRPAENRVDYVYSIDLLGAELELVHFGQPGETPREAILRSRLFEGLYGNSQPVAERRPS